MTAVCVGTLLGNFSPGAWYGWLSTIIPREVQGTFWGRRDSWISLVVILVTLPSGFVMDLVPREGKLATAALILVAVHILGCLDILIHVTLPEPPMRAVPARGSFSGMLKPLKDRSFRPWLFFTASWNFSLMLGGGLSNLYFMENLGFRNDLFGGMIASTIVGLVGTLFAAHGAPSRAPVRGEENVRRLALPVVVRARDLALHHSGGQRTFLGRAGRRGRRCFLRGRCKRQREAVNALPLSRGQRHVHVHLLDDRDIAAGLGTLASGLFLNAAGAWH